MSRVLKSNSIVMESNGCLLNNSGQEAEPVEISGSVATGDIVTARCEEMVWRARLDANKIVSNAEEYSKRIIEKASEKAANDLTQAMEEGYAQGLEKGKAQAMEMVKQQLEELAEISKEIERKKAAILAEYEDSLKDVALCIARKIIDTELQKDDKAFLNLYKKAVQELSPQDWVKLTVSKFEESFATSNTELLKSLARGAKTIKISVLENSLPGTCIVETPQSIADASVDTQISRIREAFESAQLVP